MQFNIYDKIMIFLVGAILFFGFAGPVLETIRDSIGQPQGRISVFMVLIMLEVFIALTEAVLPENTIIISLVVLIPYLVFRISHDIFKFYGVTIPLLLLTGWVYNQPIGTGELTLFQAALIITIPQIANILTHLFVDVLNEFTGKKTF